MIPVIENSGGRAFANASVDSILFDECKAEAIGVTVQGHKICAPHIISTIGLLETTQYLLPPSLVQSSELQKKVESVKPGKTFPSTCWLLRCHLICLPRAGLSVFYAFIILDGTKEELGLNHATTWHFEHQECVGI